MGRGENSMLHVTGVAASAGLAVGTIKRIHRARTGLTRVVLDCAREKALFEAAIRIGSILANVENDILNELTKFAQYFGMAFQISDDIIDTTQSFEVLGKTPKKDEKVSKATFVKFFGLDESKIKLNYYCERCCDILENNKFKSKIFMELVNSIKKRVN